MIAAQLIPFAIGREGYFDEAKTIHFDDFVYRSPLNPDTAILIPETRPPYLDDGINKTNSHQYIELGNGNIAFVWDIRRQDLRDPDWSFEDDSYKSPIEIYARVINPETGEFITDEFRILEDVEFPAIDSAGAIGADGFYVNTSHEYDDSIKYSTTVNGSNNYELKDYIGDISLSGIEVTHEDEIYNLDIQQVSYHFELKDNPKLFTQSDFELIQDSLSSYDIQISDRSFSNFNSYFIVVDESEHLELSASEA